MDTHASARAWIEAWQVGWPAKDAATALSNLPRAGATGTFRAESRSERTPSNVPLPGMEELRDVEASAPRTSERMDRLEEAYARNAPAGLRLAYFLTGNKEQAEDLVQDAFVRVGATLRHRRPIDDVDAYLRRTIVNLFTSSLRRRRVERRWLAQQKQVRALHVPAHDPADRDEVWKALQGLPDRQRAAVVLRFYEDLPERQAAVLLGCSPRALNSMVTRALQTLRASGLGGETP